jgi:hypothetical protein
MPPSLAPLITENKKQRRRNGNRCAHKGRRMNLHAQRVKNSEVKDADDNGWQNDQEVGTSHGRSNAQGV